MTVLRSLILGGGFLFLAGVAAAQHEHHQPAAPPASTPEAPVAPEPYALPAPAADPGLPAYTLEDLERRALEHNPALAQAEAMIRAADARARQAGMWPNPVIGYTAEDIPTGALDGGSHGLFVSQEIPLGGKLGLGRQVQIRDAERARIDAEAGRLEVLAGLRGQFYRVLAAQQTVRVREQLSALAAETVDLTGQLFNTGLADSPDRLAAETEASLAEADLSAARIGLDMSWAALRAAVGDAGLEPGVLQGDLAALPELDRQEWQERVLSESPRARLAIAQAERARSALARARAERLPDLEIEAGVRKNRGGRGVLEGGEKEAFADIGFRVPLFNRNQGGIAAAEAESAGAGLESDRARLALESGFAGVWSRYRSERQRAEAFRGGILDRARTAHRLYLDQYSQMNANYSQVLSAQQTLFRLEEEYVMTLERAWQAAVSVQSLLVADPAAGLAAGPSERNVENNQGAATEPRH